MTRDAAFALASAVADAGYSCTLSIGVHRSMHPSEHCSVEVHGLRFEAVALQELVAIGERHQVGLHLIGNQLSFVEGRAAAA